MNKKAFMLVLACLVLFLVGLVYAKDNKRKLTVVPKASPSSPEKRIALVIGNGSYKSGPLKNSVNDAKLMAQTLRDLGFEVKEKTDLSYADMNRVVDDFGDSIQNGTIALFYYAGHGLQSAGSNYLVPVDADIKSEPEIKYKAVNAGYVLAKMESAKNPVNIVILDACRDNPFARSFRSASKGLAKMDAPTGTIIAYATKDGMTASDGSGRNGLYTEELVKQMTVPNQKIEDVFKKVRTEVKNRSNGGQIPTEYTMLEGDFYFARAAYSGASPELPPMQEPGKGGFSMDDLEKKGQQVEANKAAWDAKLREMKKAYNQVQAYEKKGVTPDLKAAAWERFATTFSEDNPYSSEDDAMRGEAEQRVGHWQAEQRRAEEKKVAMGPRPSRTTSDGSSSTDSTTGMEFVRVKGGCYQMGDAFGDGYDNEKPVHEVCVDDFYMGKYEVTVGQWKQFVRDTGYSGDGTNYGSCKGMATPGFSQEDSHPVACVSWKEATAYVEWLTRKSGKTYRLPTEAEWEYAARSGGKSEKYSGGDNVDSVAWYDGNSGKTTHPVGTKAANGLGLHDMSGNVWEWVQDWYGGYSSGSQNNPTGPSSGTNRVLRGGSWFSDARYSRTAIRSGVGPDYRDDSVGFRVLRTK